MQDEQATAPTGVPESTSGGVETAAVETADTSSTPTDQGVQAPADVAPAEDQVNG